mmetsp:Transcript_54671/g.122967  ORF Transcript_54671/g.122967 Transcript_54671/m.122967 type:complete len:474 (-) Transcript_54671:58-1479(-)
MDGLLPQTRGFDHDGSAASVATPAAHGSHRATSGLDVIEEGSPTDGHRFPAVVGEGARMMVSTPSLVAIGVPPGVIVSAYLASGGYFMQKLHSETLFGLQNLTVYIVFVIVIILQQLFDDVLDKWFGVEHTYAFRVIVVGFLCSGLVVLVPACGSQVSVLLLGALVSFLAVAQQSSAMQLSAALVKGGGLLASFGITLGGMLPLVLSHIAQFEPGCTLTKAYAFFGCVAAVSIVCTVIWSVAHFAALARADAADVDEGSEISHTRQVTPQLVQAYRTLSGQQGEGKEGAETTVCDRLAAFVQKVLGVHVLGIFICMLSGFVVVPLFTLASSNAAHGMYLMKCLGDFLGRVLAIWHSTYCNNRGYVGPLILVGSIVLIAARVVLVAILANYLVGIDVTYVGPLTNIALVAIFTFGGYALLMIDLDSQLKTSSTTGRKTVQRRNLMAMYAGQIVGVSVGTYISWRNQGLRQSVLH